MDLLGFDENIKVIYSKLDCVLTSGDAEDYVKIILTAPQKPVVDVEISAMDAFSDHTLKIQGSKETYQCTAGSYQMKYIVEGENPEKPLIVESLKDENGYPVYCQEKLITHEETGDFEGSAFNVAVERFYDMLYRAIADGEEMEIHNENVARIIQVIECVHGQNPLPVKF